MFPDVERTIVSELQLLFHENNDLVHLFKTAIDLMPLIRVRLLFPLIKRLLAIMCVDTMLQLSTKWQLLWSVISSCLEIIFFIGETIS